MDLVVGRVVKAHGITGEVVVEIRTDDPDDPLRARFVLARQAISRRARKSGTSSTRPVTTAGGC